MEFVASFIPSNLWLWHFSWSFGKFDKILCEFKFSVKIEQKHWVLYMKIYSYTCFCSHLERNSLSIYGIEGVSNKSYRAN
jgi:hypothetical protein